MQQQEAGGIQTEFRLQTLIPSKILSYDAVVPEQFGVGVGKSNLQTQTL